MARLAGRGYWIVAAKSVFSWRAEVVPAHAPTVVSCVVPLKNKKSAFPFGSNDISDPGTAPLPTAAGHRHEIRIGSAYDATWWGSSG